MSPMPHRSWSELHKASETIAIKAEREARDGKIDQAALLYGQAAALEQKALVTLEPAQQRTKGITAVSAVALWYKANQFERAERLAYEMLADANLPEFARKGLRDLVQAIWTESSMQEAKAKFLPGHVLVSIRGGEVTTGGAPLDVVVSKVQTIQSMFYRTVEFMRGSPFRLRGAASDDIQETCRPWLLQAAPGSYQFSVAIEQPKQMGLFDEQLGADGVAEHFLRILKAATSSEPGLLEEVVPQEDYRNAFLKLSRNLSPTGKTFESIEFKTPTSGTTVSLTPEARTAINQVIKKSRTNAPDEGEELTEECIGILRGVHLEKDWLEMIVDGKTVRVNGLQDTMDDVIGPMVNKKVKVSAGRTSKGLRFRDIELED